MVDTTHYVSESVPFMKVEDVNKIKGDLKERSVVVSDEAYFKEFTDKTTKEQYIKLLVPIKYRDNDYLLSLNKKANQRLIEVLGGNSLDWVGARLTLLVVGGGIPYIMVDVLEKPSLQGVQSVQSGVTSKFV